MLALGIIDCDHRESEDTFLGHGFESDDACGGFFTAAYDFCCQVGAFIMEHFDEVAAVIYYDIRFMLKAHFDVSGVFFVGGAMICKDAEPGVRQCCCDVVLCGKAVAAGY